MIETLEKTLKYMEEKELPCAEVRLAIYLLERECVGECDKCRKFSDCKKEFVGGHGKSCEWYPPRFDRII